MNKVNTISIHDSVFWICYHRARIAVRDNMNSDNKFNKDWVEYRGWEAGLESMGVKA